MKRKKYFLKNGNIFIWAILILGTSSSIWLYKGISFKPLPRITTEENTTLIYPIQYSDTHITKNATETNPEFKHIAFAENTSSNLANIVSILKKSPQNNNSALPERGTWLWTPILEITPKYRNSIIEGAKVAGVRNIYLSIDSYLDIYVMPDGEEKEKNSEANFYKLEWVNLDNLKNMHLFPENVGDKVTKLYLK